MCFGCCGKAKWKREIVVDHKFDYIDIDEYRSSSCGVRFKYFLIYLLTFRSVFTFISDILTVTFLYMYRGNGTEGSVLKNLNNDVVISIAPYVYLGCLVMSVLLFFYDCHKSYKIIKSREISFAFTNAMAFRYYSIRWYSYFCFFERITHMQKSKDQMALFVYFSLKGWKSILFAEAPRYGISIAAIVSYFMKNTNISLDGLTRTFMVNTTLFFMCAAAVMFVLNLILMLIALILYIPLVCDIRGNLKEYCCHKIDKRIAQLVSNSSKYKGDMAMMKQRRDLQQGGGGIVNDPTKAKLFANTPPVNYQKRYSKYQIVVDASGRKYAINNSDAPAAKSISGVETSRHAIADPQQRKYSAPAGLASDGKSSGSYAAAAAASIPPKSKSSGTNRAAGSERESSRSGGPRVPPKVETTSGDLSDSRESSMSPRRPRELTSATRDIPTAKPVTGVNEPAGMSQQSGEKRSNSVTEIYKKYERKPADMTDYYVDIPPDGFEEGDKEKQ